MTSKIILKKSSVSNRVPLTDIQDPVNGLAYGELALNYADGKLYYKTSSNTIAEISGGGAGGGGGGNLTVSTTAPSFPSVGDEWIDSNTGKKYTYINDGDSSQWVEIETAVNIVSGSGVTILSDLTDVSLTAPTNGQALVWDSTTSTWKPGTVAAGGGGDLSNLSQDILPSTDVTYDLGSSTKRWRDLYLSGSTINLGGATIKTDASTGSIALVPKSTAEEPNPSGIVISPQGGISVVTSTAGEVSSTDFATAVESSSPPGSGGITVYTTLSSLPLSSVSTGTQAFVQENNRLYMWTGTGWFNIALINTNPTITTAPNSSYAFETDGTPVVLTLQAQDPEGIPITWAYQVTAGSLTNNGGVTATVAQAGNVFTITPSTNDLYTGEFSITFTASDGVNVATAASTFTLAFKIINSRYTALLVKATGNAGVNSSFVDTSTNAFAVTPAGDVQQGTFSPYSINGWSNYFDGGTNRLTTAGSAIFNLTGTSLTLECWVYMTAAPGVANRLITVGPNNAQSSFIFEISTSRVFGASVPFGAGGGVNSGATLVPLNAWTHLAFTLSGSTGTVYINGTQVGQSTGWNITSSNSNYFYIGYDATATVDGKFTGYISNVRLIKGTAVYTAAFTPSTTPLTAISGTSLLTCQSNRFVDNSTNNFTISKFGNTSVQVFSPFDSIKYDSVTEGGSAYFDGTGDRLQIPSNTALDAGTGDFCIECWFLGKVDYGSYAAAYATIAGKGSGNDAGTYGIGAYQSKAYASVNGSAVLGTTTLVAGVWYHCAVTRSGTTLRLFLNGVLEGTGTNSINLTSGADFAIGDRQASDTSGQYPFNGYISSVRLVKGTAVYTTNFTPPTEPVTAIANTSLLLNFTNGKVVDHSRKNNLQLIGNATSSTTQTKYAASSVYFDGTGDYAVQASNINFGYGTGDFTIEFWVYFNTVSSDQTILSNLTSAPSVNPHIYLLGSSSTIRYYTNNADRIVGSAVSINTWYHIAVSRASGSTRLFINGAQTGSTYTDSNNYGYSAPLAIGTYYSAGSPVTSATLNGYMEDLRITKGLARYTANFTPPTTPLLG